MPFVCTYMLYYCGYNCVQYIFSSLSLLTIVGWTQFFYFDYVVQIWSKTLIKNNIPSVFLCCTMYLDVWSPLCSHCTLIVVLVTVITLKSLGLFGGSWTYNCTNCWSLPYTLLAWHTYEPPSSTCTLLICSEAITFSANVCCRSVSLNRTKRTN